MPPIISNIVPIYNAESTIKQCVDSILSLDYKYFELLLIDDGSKDNSPAICDEYAESDERVRVRHKSNGGVSSARNVGLDNAKGEWIVFFDSDDYISENYLNGLQNCDSDLALMQYHLFKADGWHQPIEHLKRLPAKIKEDEIPQVLNCYLTDMMLRCPTAMAFRRDLIGDIRFNINMKVGEDTHFVHQYLKKITSIICYYYYYYYVGVGEDAADVKYSCTVDYAVQSLLFLKDSFSLVENRWGVSRKKYFDYIAYFKLISQNEWKQDRILWYGNQSVKALYDFVWTDLSFLQKVRLIGSMIFRT